MKFSDAPLFYSVDLEEPETSGSSSHAEVQVDSLELLERQNELLSGIIFFLGMIFAAIGVAIFWGRFKAHG